MRPVGLFDFFNRNPEPASQKRTLPELVTLLADYPTAENQNAFYSALLTSKVGARLPTDYQSVDHGQQITTTKDDQVSIPTTNGPDGTPMLLVHCDIPGMHELFPNDRFFEIEGRVVLEMAQTGNCGVIVQNSTDGRQSWAGVAKDIVTAVLASKHA